MRKGDLDWKLAELEGWTLTEERGKILYWVFDSESDTAGEPVHSLNVKAFDPAGNEHNAGPTYFNLEDLFRMVEIVCNKNKWHFNSSYSPNLKRFHCSFWETRRDAEGDAYCHKVGMGNGSAIEAIRGALREALKVKK